MSKRGFLRGTRHLILDRDTKYTDEFCKVLARERIHLIRLPAAVTEFEGRQKVHYEAPPAARRPHRRGPRCARRPGADIHALLRSPARGRRGGGHWRLRMRGALGAYDSRAARAAARRVRFTLGTPAPMRSTPRGGLSPTWVASRNPPQSCRNGARSRTYRATSRPCCSPTVQARRKWIPTSMRENAFSRAASFTLS